MQSQQQSLLSDLYILYFAYLLKKKIHYLKVYMGNLARS